ncbi:MAG: aminodeoxychorismate lyase, partial [Candidatus Oxydemutatoraceae bacterium WSBS_2016_MAG_OTU14]
DSISTTSTFVNGLPREEVELLDRGLGFGDGVFETIAITPQKQLFLWPLHRERLIKGCDTLHIPLDIDILEEEIKRICASSLQHRSTCQQVLKIVLTRGCSNTGYRYSMPIQAMRYVYLSQRPYLSKATYTQGIALQICKHRLGAQPALKSIKHLNRIDQVLARSEWDDEPFEGIVLDHNEYLVEGTMSNIFLCLGDTLVTPQLDQCGVAGVMREYLLKRSQQSKSFSIVTKRLTLADLLNAEGVFICNSVIGIVPVREIAGLSFTIPKLVQEIQAIIFAEYHEN